MRCLPYICLCLLSALSLSAQSKEEMDLLKADEFFSYNNYVQALEIYLKVEKNFPYDMNMKRRMATCILNMHDDKSRALPYLKAVYRAGKYDDQLLLDMAKALHFAYRLDSAIIFYNKYREKVPAKQQPIVDHYIETVQNAKALIRKPVNVLFENLGKEVNTKYPDYYPFVTKDQGTLYFTSRREESMGTIRTNSGYFSSDIFFSKVKAGLWQKAKNAGGPLNTPEDEEIVGLTGDGKIMLVYSERLDYGVELMYAEQLKTKNFGRAQTFNPPVNSGKGLEMEGCITADGNTLYFVSMRKGGAGEADIYFTHKLPNGEWGTPQNAGADVNTPYSEGFPVISEDGKTLYFSSQGHTSMGGYDIFKSKWDEGKKQWGPAENIGYPINSADDDMMFSLAGNNRDGYLSAWRKEGFGDLDIYRITFQDAEKPLTAVVGNVKSSDSTITSLEALIAITDLKTNDFLDEKPVNEKTGHYIFIVEPGKYLIEITAKGHQPHKEEIIVYDKSDFTVELFRNFRIVKE